ncbi:protein of unknown function [Legionella micdadei]|uniref:Uncharacterized protein n=1 Tax=Legionella micdadei TaxID=451 RepID=A0A098GJM7_LEGMI|nr:hypothetical protein Lmic_0734 [Legionella micdadei]CEG62190.1 protein of unknown function [Legionella micdadei]SCY07902.1 hypothetical protein SAMN02982997_00804 [Legionella micdadei]
MTLNFYLLQKRQIKSSIVLLQLKMRLKSFENIIHNFVGDKVVNHSLKNRDFPDVNQFWV